MITAVILVNVERAKLTKVIDEILKVKGIMEVHAVVGEFDLAAIARVKDNQELSEIIAEKMCSQIDGITHTKTMISLNSRFNYDPTPVFGK